MCVLKSTLEAFCQRCSNGEGNNYIVGVLGGAVDVGMSVCLMTSEELAYIEESPEEPGVRCLRMELSLSPAILDIL